MPGKRLPKRPAPPKPELHPTVGKPVSVKVKDRKAAEGFSLVALDSVPVSVNSKRVPPGTYARIEKKSKKLACLVTVMPGDTHVAWDSCGTCHMYFTLCKCPGGIAACRSVEYIFDKTTAAKNGEDWSWLHPNYKGSLSQAERDARQARESRRTRPYDPTRVRQAPVQEAEPEKQKKPLAKKTLAKKPLLKKRDASSVTTSDGSIDLGKMNQEAKQTDADMLDLLRKSMQPEGKKPLAKKPLPKKKPLRKKQ